MGALCPYHVDGAPASTSAAAERNLQALKDTTKSKSLANKLACLVEFAKAGFRANALTLLLQCAAPSPN